MAIHIHEMIIRAVVTDEESQSSPGSSLSDEDLEKLVEICVDKVLDVMKDRDER